MRGAFERSSVDIKEGRFRNVTRVERAARAVDDAEEDYEGDDAGRARHRRRARRGVDE